MSFSEQDLNTFVSTYQSVEEAVLRRFPYDQDTASYCQSKVDYNACFGEAVAYLAAAYDVLRQQGRQLSIADVEYWCRVCFEAALLDVFYTYYPNQPTHGFGEESYRIRNNARGDIQGRGMQSGRGSALASRPATSTALPVQSTPLRGLDNGRAEQIRGSAVNQPTQSPGVNAVNRSRHKPVQAETPTPPPRKRGVDAPIKPVDVAIDLNILDHRDVVIPLELASFGPLSTILFNDEALSAPTLCTVEEGICFPAASPSEELATTLSEMVSRANGSLAALLKMFDKLEAGIPQTRILKYLEQLATKTAERFIFSFVNGGSDEFTINNLFNCRMAMFKELNEVFPGLGLGDELEEQITNTVMEAVNHMTYTTVNLAGEAGDGRTIQLIMSQVTVEVLTLPWTLALDNEDAWFSSNGTVSPSELVYIVNEAFKLMDGLVPTVRVVDRIGNSYIITKIVDPEREEPVRFIAARFTN